MSFFAPGAQIDHVVDRADGVVNLCEMKFYYSPFSISAAYERELLRKRDIFVAETRTRKAAPLTLVCPQGVEPNAHRGAVQEVIGAKDLFWRP